MSHKSRYEKIIFKTLSNIPPEGLGKKELYRILVEKNIDKIELNLVLDYLKIENVIYFQKNSDEIIINKKSANWQQFLSNLKQKKEPINNIGLVFNFPQMDKFGLSSKFKINNVDIVVLSDCFKALFKKAKSNIKIISPFIDIRGLKRFYKTLSNKAKNGVKITILARDLTNSTNSRRFRKLKKFMENTSPKLNNMFRFYEYHYINGRGLILSSIHSKLIIVDGRHFYCGSGEIRENSFTKNLENGVCQYNTVHAKNFELVFDYLISISNEIIWGDY